jgi:hypothetical protein
MIKRSKDGFFGKLVFAVIVLVFMSNTSILFAQNNTISQVVDPPKWMEWEMSINEVRQELRKTGINWQIFEGDEDAYYYKNNNNTYYFFFDSDGLYCYGIETTRFNYQSLLSYFTGKYGTPDIYDGEAFFETDEFDIYLNEDGEIYYEIPWSWYD